MMGGGLGAARDKLNDKRSINAYRFSFPSEPILESLLSAVGDSLTTSESWGGRGHSSSTTRKLFFRKAHQSSRLRRLGRYSHARSTKFLHAARAEFHGRQSDVLYAALSESERTVRRAMMLALQIIGIYATLACVVDVRRKCCMQMGVALERNEPTARERRQDHTARRPRHRRVGAGSDSRRFGGEQLGDPGRRCRIEDSRPLQQARRTGQSGVFLDRLAREHFVGGRAHRRDSDLRPRVGLQDSVGVRRLVRERVSLLKRASERGRGIRR